MPRRTAIVFLLLMAAASSARAQSVDFTIATAALVGPMRGDTNVKMSDYVYLVDPLNRGLTMAGASIHLTSYDRSRPSPSLSERFAVLLGGAITPAGGLGVGGSMMIVRGFAVNAGMAWLLVHAAKDDQAVGSVPPDFSDPFKTGVAHAWFIGANYTLFSAREKSGSPAGR